MAFSVKNANPEDGNETEIKQCEQLERMLTEIATEIKPVRDWAEKLPEINNRFVEICDRLDKLEAGHNEMRQAQGESEKELMETLREHINVSTSKLKLLTDESVKELSAASTRTQKETETIVADMQKSLDSISNSITESLKPFKESLLALEALDSTTTKAMDRLSAAVEAIAKVSQPHADLAKATAELINESIANIKSIASASTQIITVELRDAVDKAVKELKTAANANK